MEVSVNESLFQVIGKKMTIGGPMLEVEFSFIFVDTFPYLKATVINSDEVFRRSGVIITDGDYSIRSQACAELRANELFIWGDRKDKDNLTDQVVYATQEARNKALASFCELVKRINTLVEEIHEDETLKTYVIGSDKLRVEFVLNKKTPSLSGKVLAMDESLRGLGEIAKTDLARVESIVSPSLADGTVLHIRGEHRDDDDTPFNYAYDSFERRNRMFTNFFNMIATINYS